jgi:hypothetical protein
MLFLFGNGEKLIQELVLNGTETGKEVQAIKPLPGFSF